MPESKSKALITARLQTERRRLEQNLAQLKPEEMLLPGAVGESSVKDVLAHLADWEAHMPIWIETARKEDPFSDFEPGLRWDQFEVFGQLVYEFNQRVYARHKDQSLEEVLAYFHETHRQFMEMVEAMPEDEMLTRSRYTFLGGGAVVDWLGAYAAHDAWAKTKIRKWVKTRKE